MSVMGASDLSPGAAESGDGAECLVVVEELGAGPRTRAVSVRMEEEQTLGGCVRLEKEKEPLESKRGKGNLGIFVSSLNYISTPLSLSTVMLSFLHSYNNQLF